MVVFSSRMDIWERAKLCACSLGWKFGKGKAAPRSRDMEDV